MTIAVVCFARLRLDAAARLTNQMSQEIAVNPFLWVLPLCLYLASFILCFDSDRWYWREMYLFLLIPALALATLVLVAACAHRYWHRSVS